MDIHTKTQKLQQNPLANNPLANPKDRDPMGREPGRRFISVRLGSMSAVFLTALDADSKIVAFVAGFLRVSPAPGESQIIGLSTKQILQGFVDAVQPDMRCVSLKGEDARKRADIKLQDIPALSTAVWKATGECAAGWGLYSIKLDAHKPFLGPGRPNGESKEVYLNNYSWNVDANRGKNGEIPGSNVELRDRMSPAAFRYSKEFPSVTYLAAASAALFGGSSELPHNAEYPLSADPVVDAIIRQEVEIRQKKKDECKSRRFRGGGGPSRRRNAPAINTMAKAFSAVEVPASKPEPQKEEDVKPPLMDAMAEAPESPEALEAQLSHADEDVAKTSMEEAFRDLPL